MAPSKLNVYNLAEQGVNTTKSAVHLEDGELTKAQNVQVDPAGEIGGVRKRDGLAKLNGSALAGSVKGLIALPLPDLTTYTRRFYTGIDDNGNTPTGAWRTSTTGTSWSTTLTSSIPAVPASVSQLGAFGTKVSGGWSVQWCKLNNKLYYPANNYVGGTTYPTIHMFDGTTDIELCSVPQNPNASQTAPFGVLSIIPYDSTRLVLTTYDENTRSRILVLDTITGQLAHVAPQTDLTGTGKALAKCVVMYQGQIWFGSHNGAGGSSAKLWHARLTDTTWTQDTNTPVDTGRGYVTGMAVFKGDLYVGYGCDIGAAALIRKRTTSTGAYSTVFTAHGTGVDNYAGPLIVNSDDSKMYAFGQQNISTAGTDHACIFSTTDGAAWTQEVDVQTTLSSSYTASGFPAFDTNGDLYWPVINPAASPLGQILKRTAAGSWSVADSSNYHARGPLVLISYL